MFGIKLIIRVKSNIVNRSLYENRKKHTYRVYFKPRLFGI